MKSLIQMTAVVAIALTTMACNSTPRMAGGTPSCAEINTVDITLSVSEAKQRLSSGHCHARFKDYFEGLLKAGQGDPGMGNKRLFNDFLSWAQQYNVISKQDAVAYFNQYFGERFVSLNGTYNTCSQSEQQGQIFASLNREMQMKKEGILSVLGDKELFATVSKQKEDLEAVLEATWMACAAE